MEKVSKENGAKHDEAQERESEPEMEVNDTPENPTEVDIGKTPDEQKKVEREVDPQVKENSKKKSMNTLILTIATVIKITQKKTRL